MYLGVAGTLNVSRAEFGIIVAGCPSAFLRRHHKYRADKGRTVCRGRRFDRGGEHGAGSATKGRNDCGQNVSLPLTTAALMSQDLVGIRLYTRHQERKANPRLRRLHNKAPNEYTSKIISRISHCVRCVSPTSDTAGHEEFSLLNVVRIRGDYDSINVGSKKGAEC